MSQNIIVAGIQGRKQQISNNIAASFATEATASYSNLIIINASNEILFLKRANIDAFGPGKWCVPGGKIEPLETTKQAAVRETVEETRIPLTIKDIKNVAFVTKIKKPSFEIFYYQLRLSSDFEYDIVLDSNEHQQYMWLTVEQALQQLNLLLDVGTHLKQIFKVEE